MEPVIDVDQRVPEEVNRKIVDPCYNMPLSEHARRY